MLTKGDKILIIFILISSFLILAAFQVFGFGNEQSYAQIEVFGAPYQKISLGDDGPSMLIKVPGMLGTSIIEVDKNRVRVVSSPCPDKDCMRQGWASKPGQMLVCLPNRVVVKIVNQSIEQDTDAVSF